MASRRQRRRRHDQARQHQAESRRRLRAALATAPLTNMKSVERHMDERGYEPDWKLGGKWRRKPRVWR